MTQAVQTSPPPSSMERWTAAVNNNKYLIATVAFIGINLFATQLIRLMVGNIPCACRVISTIHYDFISLQGTAGALLIFDKFLKPTSSPNSYRIVNAVKYLLAAAVAFVAFNVLVITLIDGVLVGGAGIPELSAELFSAFFKCEMIAIGIFALYKLSKAAYQSIHRS